MSWWRSARTRSGPRCSATTSASTSSIAFVIGSALAGLSGVLYTAWGQYITPSSMGLTAAALPVVWVAVGGRSDLTATLVGTFAVLSVFQTLTIYGSQYALVVMGALLVVVVLFAPEGLIPGIAGLSAARLERGAAMTPPSSRPAT